MITERQLREALMRIRLDRDRAEGKLRLLAGQRDAKFSRVVRASSSTLRYQFAEDVKTVDFEVARARQLIQILTLQSRLLGHLIYARENSDPLQTGPLAKQDWPRLLSGIAQSRARQDVIQIQLERVLDMLSPPTPLGTIRREDQIALVKHVPDGDGLKLADGRRVRYIGIDAPEISGYDGQPQLLAMEARDLNKRLVEGKWVRLVSDTSDTDRYGRMLRYVYAGEVFVNAEMVRAGLATALTVFPDEHHAAEFRQLEEQARHARLGLWAHGYT